MKAMILAAGKGTRVRPLTYDLPKPMIPLLGKPVMAYLVEHLHKYGVTEIMVNVSHLHEKIEEYFGEGHQFGVQIGYSFEGYTTDSGEVVAQPIGSAGGMKKIQDFGGFFDDTTIVLCGDALIDLDLKAALLEHRRKGALASVITREVPFDKVSSYGVVVTDGNGRITKFQEKPKQEEALSNYISTGIYIFEPEVIDMIPSGVEFDIGSQLFPLLADKGLPFYAQKRPFNWLDIGSVSDYWEVLQNVLTGEINNMDVPGIQIEPGLWVGLNTSIDWHGTRIEGPVYIGSGVKIEAGATIIGPTWIGHGSHICEGAEVVRSVLFEYTRVLTDVTLHEMIVFKDYSVDRAGQMKHASEYSSEEWLNARDRRHASRKEVANDSLSLESIRMKIYPVILSGGAGTRLWPLSRAVLPKQLLPLVSDRTMLQETVQRVAGWSGLMAPLVVCGNDHRFLVAEQMREIGVNPLGILLEPVGRNTAPAVAAAAHYLQAIDPEAVMLVLPADHVIEDRDAFQAAVSRALPLVQRGALATFGIVPKLAETGYGYIRRGEPLPLVDDCFKVERFVEKPDRDTAEAFLADGGYYWNSGMFMFQAGRYLSELGRLKPEIAVAAEAAVRTGYRDLDFCRLDEAAFTSSPSDSIDYAVMEHTRDAVVVPADIGWNDVGSWSALWEVQQKDAYGNSQRGDVYLDNVSNSLVRAESRIVAVVGVKDLVVVETPDAVLVAHKDQVQRVKQVVDHLKSQERTEHLHHTRVYRPWGHYEGIDAGDRFQVKRITVKPGEKLSLQMHHHRAEHWVVVSGTARVTCGDKVCLLSENESTYIPIGMNHRLENPGKLPLHIIEVQSGSYLGEDDIVRFEDIYQRA